MLQLISAMEKEKLALEKKIEDEKTSAGKSCDNDLYNVTLNKAKKLEKTKDKAEQDLAKSQVLLSSKTTELTNVKEKLKLADSKIKDLERELRLSPSALTDQTDEEKEELKRFVKLFFFARCMYRKFKTTVNLCKRLAGPVLFLRLLIRVLFVGESLLENF